MFADLVVWLVACVREREEAQKPRDLQTKRQHPLLPWCPAYQKQTLAELDPPHYQIRWQHSQRDQEDPQLPNHCGSMLLPCWYLVRALVVVQALSDWLPKQKHYQVLLLQKARQCPRRYPERVA